MKRIFVLFFILISCNIFATWRTIETVDEFEEPTGDVRIFKYDTVGKSFVFIDKTKAGYDVGFYCYEFIGKKFDNSFIKIKIDDDKPIKLDGYVWTNDHTISATLPDNLIQKMKTGKTMKVVVEKYDSQTFLMKFYLSDFEENLKKVKSK